MRSVVRSFIFEILKLILTYSWFVTQKLGNVELGKSQVDQKPLKSRRERGILNPSNGNSPRRLGRYCCSLGV